MSNQLAPLSASVTRILSLTGFPKELKTRDIQAAFSEWENAMGGFRIKWLDDTSLLIVFQDAGIAKRVYLQALASPPASIFAPSSGESLAVIKPYDGSDAQSIIQNVNSRHNNTASRSHNSRASIAIPNGVHGRGASTGISTRNPNGNTGGSPVNGCILEGGMSPPISVSTSHGSSTSCNLGREPSPTLPSIPAHPTLGSLILSSSSFGGEDASLLNDPAIVASSADQPGAGPRIGDPGRRMLGAALGFRHPGLIPKSLNGGVHSGGGADQALKEVQKAMGGLVVAE